MYDIPSTPLVSIVMPTYNRANLLLKAVNSILNQTYENIELIIVNDASSDDTEKIANELIKKDKRIKVINLQKNGGEGVTRNIGEALSQGKYIAQMDDDDISAPDRIERQVYFLESNKGFDAVFSLVFLTDNNKAFAIRPHHLLAMIYPKRASRFFKLYYLAHFEIPNPSIMIRKETALSFPYVGKKQLGEDRVRWLIMAFNGVKFGMIRKPLVRMLRSPGHKRLTQFNKNHFDDNRRMLSVFRRMNNETNTRLDGLALTIIRLIEAKKYKLSLLRTIKRCLKITPPILLFTTILMRAIFTNTLVKLMHKLSLIKFKMEY